MAFARLLFPTEAKLAMDIANTETTSEFSGFCASKGSSGNLREVDLNETPVMRNKRLRPRMEALMKTGNCEFQCLPYSDIFIVLSLILGTVILNHSTQIDTLLTSTFSIHC